MGESWTSTTKRTIVIGGVIALYLLITWVSGILPPIVIALILAYILSPIADYASAHLRLNRTLVVVIIYLILITILIFILYCQNLNLTIFSIQS